MASIKWWEFRGKEVKVFGYACFACMKRPLPNFVRFPVFIHSTISVDKAEWYINFLQGLMPERAFNCRVVVMKGWDKAEHGGDPFNSYKAKATPRGRYAIFTIKTKGMSYGKALTYLTAFRYLHEFPDVINTFHEKKGRYRAASRLFTIFQQIHIDNKSSSGHGLMNCGPYLSLSRCKKPISSEQFRKNLANPEKDSVFSHFTP
jgi:hypothetical protein